MQKTEKTANWRAHSERACVLLFVDSITRTKFLGRVEVRRKITADERNSNKYISANWISPRTLSFPFRCASSFLRLGAPLPSEFNFLLHLFNFSFTLRHVLNKQIYMDSNFDKMRSGACTFVLNTPMRAHHSDGYRLFALETWENCFSENLSPKCRIKIIIMRELPESEITRPTTTATKTLAVYSTNESSKYVHKMDYDFGLLKSKMAERQTTTRTLTFSWT